MRVGKVVWNALIQTPIILIETEKQWRGASFFVYYSICPDRMRRDKNNLHAHKAHFPNRDRS